MAGNNHPENEGNQAQLKKYAQDLAEVYRQEKTKRKELETVNVQLNAYAEDLNSAISQVKAANTELQDAYLDTIYRLSLAAEYKDEETGNHIARTSRYCALIAEGIGLAADEVDIIYRASPMHDIGKVGIPDSILLKPGKLSTAEFESMKSHTTIGAKILSGSRAKVIQVAEQIALSHHEKWNGQGYPYGLKGEKIPLVGRIAGIIDVFDALTTKRPYKEPYPIEIAIEFIRKKKEVHFDPEVTDVFLDHIEAILQIKKEIGLLEEPVVEAFCWSERDSCA